MYFLKKRKTHKTHLITIRVSANHQRAGNFLIHSSSSLLGPFPVVIDPIILGLILKHASTHYIMQLGYSFLVYSEFSLLNFALCTGSI
ncbi:hypothetical protein CW304_12910 [Bacillus sp. UFRGS-B20]|nr:hypothetical protein CW304_12910 [Bacillus sp. UFRGS-B20]